ncbi:hypothetical protein FF38_02694 [Lucilia cuprina]|uniref:Uncharacterized protein n=1 Tax=Lucilia cuprina TaxID=7375 RepID=A0A0L0CIG5_LUCCU|nr:hypothetical protein FF38_02694 [Lucilia cuprina]
MITDIPNESDQEVLIINEHNRVHRNADEIKAQLLEKRYFQQMMAKDEIVNLQYAIHWAKVGVINSFILSHEELKNLNKLTMCKYSEVEDISESICLPNLIRSKPSKCTRELFDINGTFLIKYHNETVSVNGKNFSGSEITYAYPLLAVVKPKACNSLVEETLTQELIKEMHVNNTEAIEILNIESKMGDLYAEGDLIWGKGHLWADQKKMVAFHHFTRINEL